jgi:hypothetical protein
MALLSFLNNIALSISLNLFLSVSCPSVQLTLIPDVVLVSDQGDGGSVSDGCAKAGRIGLLL